MLEIRDLYKRYGTFTAVNGLNLQVQKGELFGFVGPNGAGKTTTMRIVSGLLKADSGFVMVEDVDVLAHPDKVKEMIGYMPDFFGVYDNLKALEYMEFFASVYGIVGMESKKLCLELMDLVNLSDKTDSYVDALSRGMKQRLCLARSLVNNPKLLILDEPASGLDPRARFEMKEILKNLCDMGKTIIISSHILPELAEMCTNIGIIKSGSMVLCDKVENITSTISSGNPLSIFVEERQDRAAELIRENPLTVGLAMQDTHIKVQFKGERADEIALLKQLVEEGVPVYSFKREAGNLESLFIEITGEGQEHAS